MSEASRKAFEKDYKKPHNEHCHSFKLINGRYDCGTEPSFVLYNDGYQAGLEAAAKLCDDRRAKKGALSNLYDDGYFDGTLGDAEAIRKLKDGE